jgi:hypothetical protein
MSAKQGGMEVGKKEGEEGICSRRAAEVFMRYYHRASSPGVGAPPLSGGLQ